MPLDTDRIETTFEHSTGVLRVRLPERTTLAQLEAWSETFQARLERRKHGNGWGLLLDTNCHDFESIACLRFLRSFLHEITQADLGIHRIAFVQPTQYRQPEVLSSHEAYFATVEAAYRWLCTTR